MLFLLFIAYLLLPMLLPGCAVQALSSHDDAPESRVLPPPADAPLVMRIQKAAAEHPKLSGFHLLIDGESALSTRLAMIDSSVNSIDAQYYIWHNDATGRLLLSHLLDAAERGVRVRLLIDDIHSGEDRSLLQALDAHPRIEIRLFNPANNGSRGLGWVSRGLEFVLSYDRLNHRMHNKVLITDGNQAVVGGRNIGNEYFDRNGEKNFRDLDVLLAGPAALRFGKIFDRYWAADPAIPVNGNGQDLLLNDSEDWARIRSAYGMTEAEQEELPGWDKKQALQKLVALIDRMTWASARVFAGSPEMVEDEDAETMADQLLRSVPKPKKELLLESAYFIPSPSLIRSFRNLHQEGVPIRILTNSMRSNDVLAAHAGYADRRREVLEAGADLHEWRSDNQPARHRGSKGFYASRANLHTKAYVIDRSFAFIGSYNIDPRSTDLNTECGILIHSPALAAEVATMIENGMQETNSWKLSLDKQQLRWEGLRKDQPVEFTKEPDSSLWQRLRLRFLALLPIDQAL